MNWKKIIPISLIVVGVICIGLGGGLGWGAFPSIVKSQIEENIDLTDTDSEGYKNFKIPPVPVYIRFTFFNVENPLELVTQKEKAKFSEKGPYAYREVREKNITFYGTDYLEYAQYRHFEFDPEKSCEGCKKDDKVRILNMPLIGAVATCLEMGGTQTTAGLSMLSKVIDNTPESMDLFLEDTVDNILFQGVDNRLVQELKNNFALKSRLPPAVQDNGFAIFNTKNATTNNECYRVDTTVDGHSEILMWGADLDNLKTNLSDTRTCPSTIDGHKPSCNSYTFKPWWNYPDITGNITTSPCNQVRGTNAEQFPPFLDERTDEDLWIFTTDLCRSLYLRYLEDHDIDGIQTLRYSIPKDATNINKTENVCFCKELAQKWDDECIKKIDGSDELDITACEIKTCHDGLQDVSKCMLSPVIMSSPHFYLAEKQLDHFAAEDNVLNPVEADHMTYLDIEPNTGLTLSAHKRIQVNMPIMPTDSDMIVFLKDIPSIPAFPVVWLDEGADIDQENIDKIKSMVTTPLLILDVTKWVLIGVGISGILLGAAVLLIF